MRLLLPLCSSPSELRSQPGSARLCKGGCRCSLGTGAPRSRSQQQQELLGAGEHVKQIEVITHPLILMETRGEWVM